jgi:hypothetical protein
VTRVKQKACAAVDRAGRPKPKPKRKQSAKRDAADISATCVSEVESIVRSAVSRMDAEGRVALSEQLAKAIRAIMDEADDARDDARGDYVGSGEAADRWVDSP